MCTLLYVIAPARPSSAERQSGGIKALWAEWDGVEQALDQLQEMGAVDDLCHPSSPMERSDVEAVAASKENLDIHACGSIISELRAALENLLRELGQSRDILAEGRLEPEITSCRNTIARTAERLERLQKYTPTRAAKPHHRDIWPQGHGVITKKASQKQQKKPGSIDETAHRLKHLQSHLHELVRSQGALSDRPLSTFIPEIEIYSACASIDQLLANAKKELDARLQFTRETVRPTQALQGRRRITLDGIKNAEGIIAEIFQALGNVDGAEMFERWSAICNNLYTNPDYWKNNGGIASNRETMRVVHGVLKTIDDAMWKCRGLQNDNGDLHSWVGQQKKNAATLNSNASIGDAYRLLGAAIAKGNRAAVVCAENSYWIERVLSSRDIVLQDIYLPKANEAMGRLPQPGALSDKHFAEAHWWLRHRFSQTALHSGFLQEEALSKRNRVLSMNAPGKSPVSA